MALGSSLFLRKAVMTSQLSSVASAPRGLGTDEEEEDEALATLVSFFLTTGAFRGFTTLTGFLSRSRASS